MSGKGKSAVATQVCAHCGEAATVQRPLRRGRCARCYDRWAAKKPVGLGAVCANCGERRRIVLRQFELHRLWVVLCHNCAAMAQALAPLPRSVEALQLRLKRERRWGDRRAESVGAPRARRGTERREGDRRVSDRNIFDASGLIVEMELELEADYASDAENRDPDDAPITGIHPRLDPSELE